MNLAIPFQYAVLRYVHDLAGGEFLNVGLALYSKSARYLRVELQPRYQRLTAAFPDADGEFYRRYVNHLQSEFDRLIARVRSDQLSLLDEFPEQLESLLASILPPDDSSVQFGPMSGGMAENLDGVFEQLYQRFVEQYLTKQDRASRDDDEVWHTFKQPLAELQILHQLQKHVVRVRKEAFEFDHAWKNGAWNVMQPVSFDLIVASSIRRKAHEWLGSAHLLGHGDLSHLYILLGKPQSRASDIRKAYDAARDTLAEPVGNLKVKLVEEDEAADFAKDVRRQIAAHK